VTKSKSPSVVTIRLNSFTRWLLLLPALLAIFGSWFVVRWYVGDTVAEYAPTVEEGGIEMARMAVRWAPDDPLTHWRLGSLEEKVFSAQNMAAAVREYQLAVTLSPTDYRYWMELGRALEASGDRESGEKALRRAVELAPAYSHPRWHFGNLLLREGKVPEAFEQLGHAAEADNEMRPQVFGLAMLVFGNDVNEIARVASVSPGARMQFAIYLVTIEKFDDAMRMWATISPADRRGQSELSQELKKSLLSSQQFRAALEVMRETDPDTALPQLGQFSNGGFESSLAPARANSFDWVFTSRTQAQIGIDSRAHNGHGSLRIVFSAPSALERIQLSQTVVVEPGALYRLECYVRTEELIGVSTPALAIVDPMDSATLAGSAPLATGTSDWQRIVFDFKTNPKHDGVTIGFRRALCGEGQICPIFGTVWYDDFSLQRIDGPGAPRGESGSAKH
jgi:hypothetical protein